VTKVYSRKRTKQMLPVELTNENLEDYLRKTLKDIRGDLIDVTQALIILLERTKHLSTEEELVADIQELADALKEEL